MNYEFTLNCIQVRVGKMSAALSFQLKCASEHHNFFENKVNILVDVIFLFPKYSLILQTQSSRWKLPSERVSTWSGLS